MSTVSSPAALPKHIETLLSDRSKHVAAIAAIDSTLSKVSAALGGTPASAAPAKAVAVRKAPAKKPVAKAPMMKAPAKAPAKAPVKKAKGGLTANEFVIEFIKAKKNPTSQEINKHWVASGRKGMADNNLSLLTKAKTLKRTPLEGGQRGSRYTVA
jgi:hypothetical protein